MKLIMITDLFLKSGATISECGQYRYHLWRIWEDERPIMVFVMLNPSTADASEDDPTIRRCIGFAKRDGFGGISVKNVFALRATNPKELLKHPNPRGPENDKYLLDCRGISLLTRLVVAWGNRENKLRSGYANAANICCSQSAYCLGMTKSGDPRHPLYLANDTPLIPWKMPTY